MITILEKIKAKTPFVEENAKSIASRLNILRAGVMGANDGIMSTAGIIMGFSGANQSKWTLLIAGVSAMFAGAISMGGGEYVSVSTQRDMQDSICEKQTKLFNQNSAISLKLLNDTLINKGMSRVSAKITSQEIMDSGNVKTYLSQVFGIGMDSLINPWHAAMADFLSFMLGALLPLMCIFLFSDDVRNYGIVGSVIVALYFTGFFSSKLGGASPKKGAIRNVLVGLLTMVITYYIGTFFK